MLRRASFVVALVFLVSLAASVSADVKTEEKSQVKFGGVIGRLVNLFGGRAAREGLVSTVALKGDRKATFNESTGEIVDLAEEKIYNLDIKRKTYTVTTFAELRRQMQEARERAEKDMREARAQERPAEPAQKDPNQKEVEIDFDIKETGAKKTLNGFDTRQVVTTITVREKGKKLNESGGLVLTGDMWLAPRVREMRELAEFDMKYAQKLAGPMMADAQQMAAALAMYPGLKDALARFQKENVNLDGTPIQSVVTVDAVPAGAQASETAPAQAEKKPEPEEKPRRGLGGLMGRLGKVARPSEEPSKPGQRATVMTFTSEVLKISPSVSPGDTAVPAGFQMKSSN